MRIIIGGCYSVSSTTNQLINNEIKAQFEIKKKKKLSCKSKIYFDCKISRPTWVKLKSSDTDGEFSAMIDWIPLWYADYVWVSSCCTYK